MKKSQFLYSFPAILSYRLLRESSSIEYFSKTFESPPSHFSTSLNNLVQYSSLPRASKSGNGLTNSLSAENELLIVETGNSEDSNDKAVRTTQFPQVPFSSSTRRPFTPFAALEPKASVTVVIEMFERRSSEIKARLCSNTLLSSLMTLMACAGTPLSSRITLAFPNVVFLRRRSSFSATLAPLRARYSPRPMTTNLLSR